MLSLDDGWQASSSSHYSEMKPNILDTNTTILRIWTQSLCRNNQVVEPRPRGSFDTHTLPNMIQSPAVNHDVSPCLDSIK